MDTAFVRPIFNKLHEIFSDWVLLNVKPLGGVLFGTAKSMMPATRLKLPIGSPMPPSEITLPKRNPFLDGKRKIVRRAKRMKMVGH